MGAPQAFLKWLPLHQGWVCIQIWADFAWGWTMRMRIGTDSAHHIHLHHLPIRPAHPLGPGRKDFGLKKSWPNKEEGSPIPPHESSFFSHCREVPILVIEALSHRVSARYRKRQHFHHQLLRIWPAWGRSCCLPSIVWLKGLLSSYQYQHFHSHQHLFHLSAILEMVRPGPHFLLLLTGDKNPLPSQPSIVLV